MHPPHLRAADSDRAAVADVLGRHMSAGRLTVDEFDERLTRVYAARTFGELDELIADLPAHLPEPARPTAPEPSAGLCHRVGACEAVLDGLERTDRALELDAIAHVT